MVVVSVHPFAAGPFCLEIGFGFDSRDCGRVEIERWLVRGYDRQWGLNLTGSLQQTLLVVRMGKTLRTYPIDSISPHGEPVGRLNVQFDWHWHLGSGGYLSVRRSRFWIAEFDWYRLRGCLRGQGRRVVC